MKIVLATADRWPLMKIDVATLPVDGLFMKMSYPADRWPLMKIDVDTADRRPLMKMSYPADRWSLLEIDVATADR